MGGHEDVLAEIGFQFPPSSSIFFIWRIQSPHISILYHYTLLLATPFQPISIALYSSHCAYHDPQSPWQHFATSRPLDLLVSTILVDMVSLKRRNVLNIKTPTNTEHLVTKLTSYLTLLVSTLIGIHCFNTSVRLIKLCFSEKDPGTKKVRRIENALQ
jgi:hypothetical protein